MTKWKIGNITIDNQVVLAPMAGISNPTYLKICEELKVGYAITELISAEAIIRDNAKTWEMLEGLEKLHIPFAIQLFGSNPETMQKAAIIVNKKYPKAIIDINMGCPVPKIAIKNEAGSALLKNPELVREIIQAVSSSVDTPVTVKIRSGWDDDHINAPLIAKIAEESGAKAISIHARTRKQGYSGKANWAVIKEVVDAVSIPVIGNGDIMSCYDAKRMLEETHAQAIMIGRALLGNPWLIKECVEYLDNGLIVPKPTYNEKIDMMEKHLKRLVEDRGESLAVLEIRTHLLNYLKGMPENKEIKNTLCMAKDYSSIITILEDYRKKITENIYL
mgnify:CR=1 FL=1